MKLLKILFVILVFFICSSPALASEKNQKRIILVGNSFIFYNNMPSLLQHMLNEDKNLGAHYQIEAIVQGGASLKDHVSNGLVRQALQKGPVTQIYIQEQSQAPLFTNEKEDSIVAAKTLVLEGRKAGAKMFMVSTWPFRAGHEFYKSPAYSNFTPLKNVDDMEARISAYYSSTAKSLGAGYIPLGQQWLRVTKTHPNLNLYDPDGRHPNLAGSYLYALMLYKSITGFAPSDDIWVPAGLDTKTVQILKSTVR